MLLASSLLACLLRAALCGFFDTTNQAGSSIPVFSKELFQCNMKKNCRAVAMQKNGTGFKFFENENDPENGNSFDIVWKKIPGEVPGIFHINKYTVVVQL